MPWGFPGVLITAHTSPKQVGLGVKPHWPFIQSHPGPVHVATDPSLHTSLKPRKPPQLYIVDTPLAQPIMVSYVGLQLV